MKFEEFFNEVIKDNEIHAKWLNSLSYLEYSGFRKIVKSQASDTLDDTILSHMLEEVRHSFYFKKLAIAVGGARFNRFEGSTLLSAKAVKNYFYSLDHGILKILESYNEKKSTYFLVTWLIEERALAIYQTYQDVLMKSDHKISLTPILNDESKHLENVIYDLGINFPNWEILKSDLRNFENKCFVNLWNNLVAELGL